VFKFIGKVALGTVVVVSLYAVLTADQRRADREAKERFTQFRKCIELSQKHVAFEDALVRCEPLTSTK